MDWKAYRAPLLRSSWYPVQKTDTVEEPGTKAMLRNFGPPIDRVSLLSRQSIAVSEKKDLWPACNIENRNTQLGSFFSRDIQLTKTIYITELTDVDVLLPFGIVWSSSENQIYKELYMHSNHRASYFFIQSHYTDWNILKARWMPRPVKIAKPCYWAYEPQYTNLFHYICDNFWKLDLLSTKPYIPEYYRNMDFFSAPTMNSTYISTLLNHLPSNIRARHLYFDHGYYHFKTLIVPWVCLTFNGAPALNEGFYHRQFDADYFDSLRSLLVDSPRKSRRPYKLMLLREDAEHRNITNVKDVKRALEKLGYIPYNPAFDSLERQAYTFSRATHVVGLHGAALTNLVWCDRTLTLIEIIPAHHQDYGYRGLCGAKKIRHNVFIADTCNQPTNLVRPPPYRDVVIDVDKLCEFVLQTEKDNG